MSDEVLSAASPRLTTVDAEPAFLLQKVEEDNLAKEFLDEVVTGDTELVEFLRNRGL